MAQTSRAQGRFPDRSTSYKPFCYHQLKTRRTFEMEFEVDDNTEAASKRNEIHFSDESSGDDGSDSNYLASNTEDEDRNTEIEDEVCGVREESEVDLPTYNFNLHAVTA
ncbi:hypothetical protein RIF29_22068 [Crotalaria pallida]|uniref:Uncharacterized protein n=1 Tax=Crotalaria pallida TaxID=3830 RepID=A0AAN9FCN2_CROPI